MIPTNISSIINGRGKTKGRKKLTTSNNTSPAKILPNNRNEKEKTLTDSDKISKKPSTKEMGLAKFKNRFI